MFAETDAIKCTSKSSSETNVEFRLAREQVLLLLFENTLEAIQVGTFVRTNPELF